MGGAALGALRGLRGLGASNLPKKTEKTVAAAKELNGFLQGFVEQVHDCLLNVWGEGGGLGPGIELVSYGFGFSGTEAVVRA